MTEGRANALRRQIAETLKGSSGPVDEWTARELRRAERRLAKIERAERRRNSSRRYAQRQADSFAEAGDRAAADYWQAIADGTHERTPADAVPENPAHVGTFGRAYLVAEGKRREGRR